jgi:hypothetical protein
MTQITNGIFIAQFFNTAILILIVNAAAGNKGSLTRMFFQGQFLDYSDQWYATVGYAITQTMIINALMPLINEIIAGLSKWKAVRSD